MPKEDATKKEKRPLEKVAPAQRKTKVAKPSPAKPSKVAKTPCITIKSSKVFGALSDVVSNDDLKDVELHLNQKVKLKVHRLVLAAMSKPLCRKLKATATQVSINDISDIDAFKSMLDFMYGKSLQVNLHNVVSLLTVSCIWQVEGLKTQCEDFLTANVNLTNAAQALKVAEKLELPKVAEVAAMYVAKHLSKFEDSFFQSLPDSAFMKIFKREDLAAQGESKVIHLVFLRALGEPDRLDNLLRSCVRFVDLTDEELLQLLTEARFNTLPRRQMLVDAMVVNKLKNSLAKKKDLEAKYKALPYTHKRSQRRKNWFWS